MVECYNVYMQRYCEYLDAHDAVSAILAIKEGKQESTIVAELVEGDIEPLIEQVCSRPGFVFFAKAIYPCTHVSETGPFPLSKEEGADLAATLAILPHAGGAHSAGL